MKSIKKLMRGDMSLAKSFWLFAAVGTAAIILFFYAWDAVQLVLVLFAPSVNIFRMMYVSTAIQTFATAVFIAIVPIAIWRSARNYEGSRSWGVLAKGGVLVFSLILMLSTAGRLYVSGIVARRDDTKDIADPARNSINAASSLKRDARFPYTGFWQVSCDPKDVGITIEGENRVLKQPYRLEFCGEQGCGLRGYSKIVGDPEFRIIDLNTIEFEASTALRYPTTYHRCG
jgi:hypothetical protein